MTEISPVKGCRIDHGSRPCHGMDLAKPYSEFAVWAPATSPGHTNRVCEAGITWTEVPSSTAIRAAKWQVPTPTCRRLSIVPVHNARHVEASSRDPPSSRFPHSSICDLLSFLGRRCRCSALSNAPWSHSHGEPVKVYQPLPLKVTNFHYYRQAGEPVWSRL